MSFFFIKSRLILEWKIYELLIIVTTKLSITCIYLGNCIKQVSIERGSTVLQ